MEDAAGLPQLMTLVLGQWEASQESCLALKMYFAASGFVMCLAAPPTYGKHSQLFYDLQNENHSSQQVRKGCHAKSKLPSALPAALIWSR